MSWVSKRQPTVALSTAEAEYTTACLAAQEIQWIRQMLTEIGAPISKEPTTVHADSQSAIPTPAQIAMANGKQALFEGPRSSRNLLGSAEAKALSDHPTVHSAE